MNDPHRLSTPHTPSIGLLDAELRSGLPVRRTPVDHVIAAARIDLGSFMQEILEKNGSVPRDILDF